MGYETLPEGSDLFEAGLDKFFHRTPVIVAGDEAVVTVCHQISQNNASAATVVDEHNSLLGVVTYRDLVKPLWEGKYDLGVSVFANTADHHVLTSTDDVL